MKLLICSLMVCTLIGCNSTTYECVEVYGEVGIMRDGCLIEPIAGVSIEFAPEERYKIVNDKLILLHNQTTVTDSLGRWILTACSGDYRVFFEKIDYPSFRNNFHLGTIQLITVPNQPKWRFTIK